MKITSSVTTTTTCPPNKGTSKRVCHSEKIINKLK